MFGSVMYVLMQEPKVKDLFLTTCQFFHKNKIKIKHQIQLKNSNFFLQLGLHLFMNF